MQDASVSDGRISFGIGGNNININLDNVFIQEVDCAVETICEELVENGNFNNNLNNFELLSFDGAQASWYHNQSGKYASIKVQNGKDKRWKVQMRQKNIQLKSNTRYTLSFKTKADGNKYMYVNLTDADNTKCICLQSI